MGGCKNDWDWGETGDGSGGDAIGYPQDRSHEREWVSGWDLPDGRRAIGRCLGRAVVGRVLDREKKRRERGRGAVRIGVRAVVDRIGEVSCAVSAGLFPIFWRLRSCFQHFHAGHG